MAFGASRSTSRKRLNLNDSGAAAALEHLTEELEHLALGILECASASRHNLVHPSSRVSESSLGTAKISLLLEPVQDGVQRARAQCVPASGEFFDHPKPIDRTCGSVMQKVQVNQATVEPPVRHSRVSLAQWDGIDARSKCMVHIGVVTCAKVSSLDIAYRYAAAAAGV